MPGRRLPAAPTRPAGRCRKRSKRRGSTSRICKRRSEMKKVLIAGASGLVGTHALRHFMQLPGWEALGVSRRAPAGLEAAGLVSWDLLDRARCAEVFGAMQDVTHLVYAALYEKPGLIAGWRDPDQMSTNLAMLENLFEPLEAAGALEQVTLLQ